MVFVKEDDTDRLFDEEVEGVVCRITYSVKELGLALSNSATSKMERAQKPQH